MKKIILTVLVVMCGIFIGCNRDEVDNNLQNELRYNADNLMVTNGYVLDYGLRGDYYYWDVIVTDGQYDDYSGEISQETTYAFVANLYSTTDDLTGEFVFGNSGSKFFTASSKLIDNLSEGTGPAVESGTITIDGTSPTFTFDVDAVVGGSTLKGSFDGTFKIEPGSFNESNQEDGNTSYQWDLSYGTVFNEGPTNAGRTDGVTYTHYIRNVYLTNEEFDLATECAPNPRIILTLFSYGESGPLEGTYTYNGVNSSFFYASGFGEFGEYWNAGGGTITITHDEGDNYYFTWDLEGYVGGPAARNEGNPTGTIQGEFKYAFDISETFYCD